MHDQLPGTMPRKAARILPGFDYASARRDSPGPGDGGCGIGGCGTG